MNKLIPGAFAVLALAGCGPAQSAQPPASSASGSTPIRSVHSPGVVTDDMHLAVGQCHIWNKNGRPMPDKACTPGAIDPAVTQANIKQTICVTGYTATVRPPESNTNKWKAISEKDYNNPGAGEYDHLIPLELGGANSTSNLWPEPGTIPNVKDSRESALRREVCSGKMTLAAAQQAFARDWTTA